MAIIPLRAWSPLQSCLRGRHPDPYWAGQCNLTGIAAVHNAVHRGALVLVHGYSRVVLALLRKAVSEVGATRFGITT